MDGVFLVEFKMSNALVKLLYVSLVCVIGRHSVKVHSSFVVEDASTYVCVCV